MPFAFVFPGQGSQSVGMLEAARRARSGRPRHVRRSQQGARLRSLAARAGRSCRKAQSDGIHTTGAPRGGHRYACVCGASSVVANPAAVSGHSLGEYTALVAAGALDFLTAIDVVKFRGQVMQEAVPAGTGLMAVVLGLSDADVEAVCAEAAQGGGVVEAVNFNSAGQVVIAGATAAVQRAMEIAKAKGAKRAMPLAVSVPSHSSLMKPAAERLGQRLESVEFKAPTVRYISAVDGKQYADVSQLRALLVKQLASPVRWQDTVRALAASGATQIIECGPGKVLMGLNKRVEGVSGVTFSALEDSATLDAALAATKGA